MQGLNTPKVIYLPQWTASCGILWLEYSDLKIFVME